MVRASTINSKSLLTQKSLLKRLIPLTDQGLLKSVPKLLGKHDVVSPFGIEAFRTFCKVVEASTFDGPLGGDGQGRGNQQHQAEQQVVVSMVCRADSSRAPTHFHLSV